MPSQSTGGRRIAFVTGASQGLGQAIARALASSGYDLAISSRRHEALTHTVKLVESAGARGVPIELDLRSPSSMEQAFAQIAGTLGDIDVLVNNAGVTLRKSALEVTPGEWDEVMTVNLTGTFFMCQQMGRHLVAKRKPGSIVNISSTHGLVGFPQRSAYGISKAGILHATRMLALEWAGHGIRVNAIAPGTIETPTRAEYFKAEPEARKAMLARVPLHRFATPEDVAAAVCYLAGPQAGFVTGHTLTLDGGVTAY
ncbi:MAG: SDR family oxidoreductase [Betaproteobacteria bacterium]|nr:SDR family oxidoreductase [Betaproteobacteria bacterium]